MNRRRFQALLDSEPFGGLALIRCDGFIRCLHQQWHLRSTKSLNCIQRHPLLNLIENGRYFIKTAAFRKMEDFKMSSENDTPSFKLIKLEKQRLQTRLNQAYSGNSKERISAALSLLRAIEDIPDAGIAQKVINLCRDLDRGM